MIQHEPWFVYRDRYVPDPQHPEWTAFEAAGAIVARCQREMCKRTVQMIFNTFELAEMQRIDRSQWAETWLTAHGWQTDKGWCPECHRMLVGLAEARN